MQTRTQRHVDVTIHNLTAAQTLEELLRRFRESKKGPISLFVKRGEGADFIARVRVELSRMRKTYKDNQSFVPYFGLRFDGPFYFHSDGIAKEGFAVYYKITRLQQMKILAQFMELPNELA